MADVMNIFLVSHDATKPSIDATADLKQAVTAVIRPYENPRASQGRTVFNRYLGNG